MLHLRRVFYGKLGQLLRQRDEILQQQPKPGLPEPFNLDFKYAAMRDKEALDFTNRLTANRAEENRTYIYTGMCFFCVSFISLELVA